MNTLIRKVRKFSKSHHSLRVLTELIAIVLLWWAIWGFLDTYLIHSYPIISYVIGGVIGLLILYFDDFKLTELNN
jgi:hypothetical protein